MFMNVKFVKKKCEIINFTEISSDRFDSILENFPLFLK